MLGQTMRTALVILSAASLAVVIPLGVQAQDARVSGNPFTLKDATVESINAAFDAGVLTSEKLVALYLARIAAYENRGPTINAFINIHPDPLSAARDLDRERQTMGPRSPLHGIPVVLKDNFNTSDLPTTGASLALKDVFPAREAFVVERLRAAGAIILGKTNLTEMVSSVLDSSLGGRTSNPWDLTRTPGESSSGTGAALAAGFALLGDGQRQRSIRAITGFRCGRGWHEADGWPGQLRRCAAQFSLPQRVRTDGAVGCRSGLPARRDGGL